MNLDHFLIQEIETAKTRQLDMVAGRIEIESLACATALATHLRVLHEKLAAYHRGEPVAMCDGELNYAHTRQVSSDFTVLDDKIVYTLLTLEQRQFQKDAEALGDDSDANS